MDKEFGHKNSLFGTRGLEPGDPNRITLDSYLFQELTDWKPGLALEKNISKIIDNLKLKKELSVRLHH